jgi:lipopolysaccharide assembly protein A
MQFLKTLFWVILAVVVAIFSLNNWTPVTINLWQGLQMDTWLPIVLITGFLIGFIPYFIVHRTTRWSLQRKLTSAERALADSRTPAVIPANSPMMAPVSAPIAVPPGVS